MALNSTVECFEREVIRESSYTVNYHLKKLRSVAYDTWLQSRDGMLIMHQPTHHCQ